MYRLINDAFVEIDVSYICVYVDVYVGGWVCVCVSVSVYVYVYDYVYEYGYGCTCVYMCACNVLSCLPNKDTIIFKSYNNDFGISFIFTIFCIQFLNIILQLSYNTDINSIYCVIHLISRNGNPLLSPARILPMN